MYRFFLFSLLTMSIFATENNSSKQNKSETNATLNKNIQKAIEKEKKYKQEQKFYQGKDYNLSENKVDKSTVEKVPLIEPEYDFDITDLYSD